jgi:lipid A disaccharide synthetase
VPFISITNLIAGKKGVTNLIQHDANVENIKNEINENSVRTNHMRTKSAILTICLRLLGEPGASDVRLIILII